MVRDGITITLHELARAVIVGIGRSSIARFGSGFVEVFYVSNIKVFSAVVPEVAPECSKNVLDTEKQLTSVKSELLMDGYILTVRDVSLEEDSLENQYNMKEKFE